jgi:hypothetical protein
VDGVEAAPLALDGPAQRHHVLDDAQVGRDAEAVVGAALGGKGPDLVGPPRDDAHPRAAAGILAGDGVANAAGRA